MQHILTCTPPFGSASACIRRLTLYCAKKIKHFVWMLRANFKSTVKQVEWQAAMPAAACLNFAQEGIVPRIEAEVASVFSRVALFGGATAEWEASGLKHACSVQATVKPARGRGCPQFPWQVTAWKDDLDVALLALTNLSRSLRIWDHGQAALALL
eukprot:1159175-Pelagomonas_calceolata.AAC.12